MPGPSAGLRARGRLAGVPVRGERPGHTAAYEREAASVSRPALHAPFIDVAAHGADRWIATVARRRIAAALRAATRIGPSHVVVHAGIGRQIRNPGHHDRAADLQAGLLDGCPAVTVCPEDMWEPDPSILRRIVDRTGPPG